MSQQAKNTRILSSVDELTRRPALLDAAAEYGHNSVVAAVRAGLSEIRQTIRAGGIPGPRDREAASRLVETLALSWLERRARPKLRRVFNLTGTVLHTNLGRAPLAAEAVAAIGEAAGSCNVEYDLENGGRDRRDTHVSELLRRITGAEDALAVNNNAAAVLLALNSLAREREVIVSRGELIEIGGAFRLPDIMQSAGCRLVEVGTTNRTHLSDYRNAIGPSTAVIMKVHPSNFAITGFTSAVSEGELATLAHEQDLPLVVDLGSGSLADLTAYGLPPEPTPGEVLEQGADLVTFSGDKLLGGPQAGLVVGSKRWIAQLNRNPLKRTLRLDKTILAALAATLRLYENPEQLAERLPGLRLLIRTESGIREQAERLRGPVGGLLAATAEVTVEACQSQVGAGSLPVDRLRSWSLVVRPTGPRQGRDRRLEALARAFRSLPVPVIGRLQNGALVFDLRCLDDEPGFLAQLDALEAGQAR